MLARLIGGRFDGEIIALPNHPVTLNFPEFPKVPNIMTDLQAELALFDIARYGMIGRSANNPHLAYYEYLEPR